MVPSIETGIFKEKQVHQVANKINDKKYGQLSDRL